MVCEESAQGCVTGISPDPERQQLRTIRLFSKHAWTQYLDNRAGDCGAANHAFGNRLVGCVSL